MADDKKQLKAMAKGIGNTTIALLKVLKKQSPFQEEYQKLIELEEEECRKVMNQIENS